MFTGETRSAPLSYVKSVGEDFQLSCESIGSPEPSIVWMKNGRKLERQIVREEKKGRRLSSLKLTVMGVDDAGIYTCIARNMVKAFVKIKWYTFIFYFNGLCTCFMKIMVVQIQWEQKHDFWNSLSFLLLKLTLRFHQTYK